MIIEYLRKFLITIREERETKRDQEKTDRKHFAKQNRQKPNPCSEKEQDH